jgi:hypothetical protein
MAAIRKAAKSFTKILTRAFSSSRIKLVVMGLTQNGLRLMAPTYVVGALFCPEKGGDGREFTKRGW